MEEKKFYRSALPFTERIQLFAMIFFGVSLLVAVAMEKWFAAIITSFWFAAYAWRRFSYGPAGELPLILIGREGVVFDDRVCMGRNEFALKNLSSIHVAGPLADRRVRVQTKVGERKEVIRSLGRRRTAEAIVFLRQSLPEAVPVIEEEPPSWSAAIRGDF